MNFSWFIDLLLKFTRSRIASSMWAPLDILTWVLFFEKHARLENLFFTLVSVASHTTDWLIFAQKRQVPKYFLVYSLAFPSLSEKTWGKNNKIFSRNETYSIWIHYKVLCSCQENIIIFFIFPLYVNGFSFPSQ